VPDPLRLVVNPAAGHGRAPRLLPRVTAALDAAGVRFAIAESRSLEHATEIAAAAAASGEIVVAVGGDGMAGALAGTAAAAGALFGIVPAGRGNDFARVLRIPSDPAAAARVLVAGRERLVDMIGVRTPGGPETIVALSVYTGIPAIAGQIANAMAWPGGGALVYPVAALRALAGWQPATFRIEVSRAPGSPASATGGEPAVREVDAYAVVVANAPTFGAGMRVAPAALIDDGVLDQITMHRAGKAAFVRALIRVRNGSHVTMPQVSMARVIELAISSSRDMPAAADGEELRCASPLPAGQQLLIRAVPAALRVLVPPG
jgi:diacylglycerol kinase family enzyme